MFKCDQCGVCCRHLDRSEIYKDLDRGDGTCIHLNGNLCDIYEDRPLICRVDESYHVYFEYQMSEEEYYKKNYEACASLKRREKICHYR